MDDPILRAQLECYDDPSVQSGYGEGPTQEAMQELRCSIIRKWLPDIDGIAVDIGCGQGIQAEFAHKILGLEVVALDIAPRRLMAAEKERPGPRYVQGYAQEIPVESGTAKIVLAYEIFEHLSPDDARKMLREVARVLAQHGRLVLTTPNPLCPPRILKCLLQGIPLDRMPNSRPDHFNEVPPQKLFEQVAQAGLHVIALQGIGLVQGILPKGWAIMNHINSPSIQNLNLRLARRFPSLAGDILVVAEKVD